MSDTPTTYRDGLLRARRWVMSAPVMVHGQRDRVPSVAPHGFPPIADPVDGDSISNTYALRDAILYWIDRDLAEHGNV